MYQIPKTNLFLFPGKYGLELKEKVGEKDGKPIYDFLSYHGHNVESALDELIKELMHRGNKGKQKELKDFPADYARVVTYVKAIKGQVLKVMEASK